MSCGRPEAFRTPLSASLPLWLALLQEGAHALLGVSERGVEGHDLFGVGVCLLRGQPELAVERLLAYPYDQRAGLCDLFGQRTCLGLEVLRRNHPVDEAFREGFLG